MTNITNKKWSIVVFSFIGLAILIYMFSGTNVDKKFTDNLDKYELAYDEIKNEYGKLKSPDEPNYRTEGMIVDFTLNNIQIENLKTPVLKDLFKNGFIKNVVFTKNGGIIFNSKTCYTEDCKNQKTGFSGPYNHYLTKDKIEFINDKWVKVVEEKTIKNWTYYIVWTQKG